MKNGKKTIGRAKNASRRSQDLCDFCGGQLTPKVVDLDVRIKGELLVCEGLPADVCSQCGEKYFSAAVSEKIDRFLETYHREKPSRYLSTPVYSKRQVL
jgi:YgiT-type zinc finger domain-containing protein